MATTLNAALVPLQSETPSAVPSAGNMETGELAINIADKKLFVKDSGGSVVTIPVGDVLLTATQTLTNKTISGGSVTGAAVTGGTINNTPVGQTTPSAGSFTALSASSGITGNVTGTVTGNVTGNVTGDDTGNLTGNVTAASGSSSFNDVVINGTLNMNAGTSATITNITDPTNAQDAATKNYVDTSISNLVNSAPGTLDTLNELAAALGNDASFSTTVTNSLATKLPLAGGTMTGAIAMSNNKITGLGTPTASGDAVNKSYSDTKLALSGGTMTGAIAMSTNKITGLGDPTLAQDAATKNYTDSILGSATSAAISAAAAAASETNAANSASSAASSASSASSSAASAAASYDSFDDRYLGSKASDPTLDNDGNALLTGALYWSTVGNVMKVYTGTAWITFYPVNNPVDQSDIGAGPNEIPLNQYLGSAAYVDIDYFVTPTATQTLTNKTVTNIVFDGSMTEEVFTLGTSGSLALNPANGTVQTCAASATVTFTDSLSAGQSIVLRLTNGASYTINWPTTNWVTSAGNTAPTLTANDTLVFWKISTTLYGAYVGSGA